MKLQSVLLVMIKSFKILLTIYNYLIMIEELIKTNCIKIGKWTLKNGETSKYYYDIKNIISNPSLLRDIGDKIYSITKKYELIDFDYREDNTSNMFGNVIDVYMDSICKEFPEYLVNIDFVIQEMSKIGLELTLPDYMDKKYSTIFKKECLVQAQDGRGGFENILQVLQGLDKKSPDSTIIKKFYSRLPEMFKNKDLQLLSGLNNYLIFRKK